MRFALYYKFIMGISINLLFGINGLLLGVYTPEVNVKSIDFTNSRITNSDGIPAYVDLADAACIFDGDASEVYQYEIPEWCDYI